MRHLFFLTLCVSLLALARPAEAKPKGEDVDYLSLAAVLAQDGNYERAQNALSQVDPAGEDVDRARFFLVRGIIRLNQSLYAQAAEDFETSIAATKKKRAEDEDAEGVKPVLYVYLGQAYFYSDRYEKALEAMESAGAKADGMKTTWALRAEALWKLERYDEAWATLSKGLERFPEYDELRRRRIFYAIDRKLFSVAVDLGTAFLSETDAGHEDYLAVGAALRRAGNLEQAAKFLELARLKSPDTPAVSIELAQVYKQRGDVRTAASLMERIALRGVAEAFIEAAELYRQAGELYHALSLNRFIADSKTRIKQRLLILLDLKDYASIAAMARDVRRARLLEDESIRYAVAYSFFEVGDFERAERLLSGITKPDLFRKAAKLRETMARCEETPWSCG